MLRHMRRLLVGNGRLVQHMTAARNASQHDRRARAAQPSDEFPPRPASDAYVPRSGKGASMAASHLSVISVPVSDQDRACDFYVGALGFSVLYDNEVGPGMRWLQLTAPGGGTAIVLATWFDDFAPGSLRGVFIDVADIAAEQAALEAKGVAIDGEIRDTPFGRFLSLADPDGNRMDLHEPAPEA
jgi:predicted enzyme related to lactoylglutathione lyase